MRTVEPVRGGAQRSSTGTADEATVTGLIAELVTAGLVSVSVGEDGVVSFALTPIGRTVAQQMAMRRDAHSLILLGALVGSSDGLN